jgi:ribose transport system substrate-binding protein
MKFSIKQSLACFCTSVFILSSLTNCDRNRIVEKEAKQEETAATPDEEYIMVTTAVNFPMYVNHDQAAFKRWGKRRGVKTSILGPSDWDVAAQIAVIEQIVSTKPAGLLINGTDPGIAQVINKAVEAGIPTVVYDSDIPGGNTTPFWVPTGMRSASCREKRWRNFSTGKAR